MLACFALAAISVYLLSRAMNILPAGTSYAVFTGIGAARGYRAGHPHQPRPGHRGPARGVVAHHRRRHARPVH
jgi:Small Multidrug Resistance protein